MSQNKEKFEKPSDVVADALPTNWVDRFAPPMARPYLRLMRADRPIGVWLLLWPCWWSIALATVNLKADTDAVDLMGYSLLLPNIWLMVLFAIGAYFMRGAGCTINDYMDREIDGRVERTRSRPIPSGQVSPEAALVFLIFQCLIGLVILLQLNTFSILLGTASLVLVTIYPLAKRFTYWPQVFLGLAFNWGALLGWSAVTGSLSLAPILLYLGGIAWTIGYDTIYAHQDKEDDIMIGVKSTALKFGDRTWVWLIIFYGLAIALIGAAGFAAQLSPFFFAGLTAAAAHLTWQIVRLDISAADVCLKLFKSNKVFGLLVFIAILIGLYTG